MNADTPKLMKQGRFSCRLVKGGGSGALYGRKRTRIRAPYAADTGF